MITPQQIKSYLEDRKNSIPEAPDLTDVLDKLNERDKIAFYKEVLMYCEPKIQSTTVKQAGDKPVIDI